MSIRMGNVARDIEEEMERTGKSLEDILQEMRDGEDKNDDINST